MEIACVIKCLTLVLVICLSSVNSLMFMLSPNHKKCLREEIHKDVLVTGEYELSDAPGQTANLKVIPDVKYKLVILNLCLIS
jgi:p24 family protein delta-1